MYNDHSIAVVVPAYNEEQKITAVLTSMPAYIDKIFVINDCSTDATEAHIDAAALEDPRIVRITPEQNAGVGASIVRGYKEAIATDADIAVVMAGDGQMDPEDLPRLLQPLIDGECDYAKGNRLLHDDGLGHIPIQRLTGNLMLSIFTKIASGYWHISDSQGGYTAISKKALRAVNWDDCYPRYGCPNDYLVRLNIANMRVADVPVKAIYGPQWSSSLKVTKVMGPIALLLCRLFFHRLFRKYVVMNGHPIVFNYLIVLLSFFAIFVLGGYIVGVTATTGIVPKTALILFVMFLLVKIQMLFHAFDMDYRLNEHLFVFPQDKSEDN